MNSDNKVRFGSAYRRPSRLALSAVAAAAVLGLTLVGCGRQEPGAGDGDGDGDGSGATASTRTKVLWLGDSVAGAEAPALGAALRASGVRFKDASSDGGGTIVDSGEKITQMISRDTWKQLAEHVEAFAPTVIAYQVTTYDWGSRDQQRAAYEKLVATAEDAGAEVVFVAAPPIKIDGFYKEHEAQMRTAPAAAEKVAGEHGGTALFLDSSQVWGTDATADKAQRAPDGIHNCQQGAAAFAKWFTDELGKQEGFTPAPVDEWADGAWTGSERYGMLKCEG
ncbi:SGNH/GDSL hydrolase family protein [Streptomyces poriticola]|uniref:SGNH/GDSL hydrolase family protein n=1 Tax=Streptomyces poriticola TaxID=3120506 RepID=UPI002FCE0441